MLVAAHVVHVGLVLGGLAGVIALLRPGLARRSRIARLRRADRAGLLLDQALRDTIVVERAWATVPRAVWLCHALAFGEVLAVGACATADVSGLHVHSTTVAVAAGIGTLWALWLLRVVRRRAAAVAASLAGVVVTQAAVLTLSGAAGAVGRATLVRTLVFLCHPAGITPPVGLWNPGYAAPGATHTAVLILVGIGVAAVTAIGVELVCNANALAGRLAAIR